MDWFDFSLKLPITDPTWIFLLVLLIINENFYCLRSCQSI